MRKPNIMPAEETSEIEDIDEDTFIDEDLIDEFE